MTEKDPCKTCPIAVTFGLPKIIESLARKLMFRDGLNDDFYFDCQEKIDSAGNKPFKETINRYLAEAAVIVTEIPFDENASSGELISDEERPKIVCLCGSGRFREAFDKAEFNKTMAGEIVLTIGCNTHDIAREIDWQHVKPKLDELHKRKIDICDYVFVVNVGGYIGESTRGEIEYAKAHGKPIEYLDKSNG